MDSESQTPPDFDRDEDAPEPPPTWRESISDITRGILALLAFSVAVLALYVVGGMFAGLLSWAAPAVLAISAAVVLGRYLSRMK